MKLGLIKYYLTIFLLFSSLSCAQTAKTNNIKICEEKFELADSLDLTNLTINKAVVEIAKSFIGLPYAAKTLDISKEEELVIHLSGLDCYTFLESSLALARCIKSGKTTYDELEDEIELIRYRNGILDGYQSRLHYFSDWIFDTDKRGITQNITEEIGGRLPYENSVYFMSTHPEAYLQLKDNSKLVEEISQIEKEISKRKYFYIPQNKIAELESEIKSGDILGLTTGIKGLDVAHTGIAIRMVNNRIHLLHAPTVGKKIQISKEPLADYVAKNKSQTGIMVVRPLEP